MSRFSVLSLVWAWGFALFLFPGAVTGGGTGPAERYSFLVTTMENRHGSQQPLSRVLVDGPAGTDFTITMSSPSMSSPDFQMTAHFLTDPLGDGRIRIRPRLQTRRRYGVSERNLPVYEEDKQRSDLTVGMDEALVLLPFGGAVGDETLQIQIVPAPSRRSSRLAGGRPRPLEIEILEQMDPGLIQVQARRIPHRYRVNARLLADGLEVAGGRRALLLEERSTVHLAADRDGQDTVLELDLSIDEFQRSRPDDLVHLSFDLRAGTREPGRKIATGWAGVTALRTPASYTLPADAFPGSGRRYELLIWVDTEDEEP